MTRDRGGRRGAEWFFAGVMALMGSPAVYAAPFTARVNSETGIAIESGGHVFTDRFKPSLLRARMETREIVEGRLRYTFEDADRAVERMTVTADGRGLEAVYSWGSLRVTPLPRADGMDLEVKIENRDASRTLTDFEIEALALDFPAPPQGNTRWVSNRDGPAVAEIKWGGEKLLAAILTNEPLQINFGRAPRGVPNRRPLVIGGNVRTFAPGAVEIFPYGLPRVAPGTESVFRIGLRRAPADTPDPVALADLYADFARMRPEIVRWRDRRPIGMIFLQSRGRLSPKNPRGWFNKADLDIQTPEGQAELKRLFLESARASVRVLESVGAQGVVVWNVEGEEHPHPVSYIGDPRLQPILAPELNGFIDEYFQIFREAGLRTGVTLRPTQPYPDKDGKWKHGTGSHNPTERNPHNDSFDEVWPKGLPWWRFYPIVERMSRKIQFARERWGATIFYVDTNGINVQVQEDPKFQWMLLDAWVFRELRTRHPDVLLIPEFDRGPDYFAVTARYDQLDHTKRTATPALARRLYPESFIVNQIVNAKVEQLARGAPWFDGLVNAVTQGDTVFFRGWFNSAHNNNVRSIFAEAARRAPFEVYIEPGRLTLNGAPVRDTEELTRLLRERAPSSQSVAERRVYVGYEPSADRKRDIEPVLEAILKADAFLAWTHPFRREALPY